MREMLRIIPISACVLASEAATQQGGWLIESSNIVSPAQPTTTVEVWAWFEEPPGQRHAFALGDFDIVASDGFFSNVQGRRNLVFPGLNPGVVNGNIVEGVLVGQLFGVLGLIPNEDNPILVWTADWTTSDFISRRVGLLTQNTTTFQTGWIVNGAPTQLYPQGFIPGTGMIEVVPSPATATPMVVVGAMMLRRRRR